MNREILFKAKHIHTSKENEYLDGKWIEGYLCDKNYIYSPELEGQFLIDENTVCQYTGLTDKNGRKIFEGDICDRKEKFPEIVTYHDGSWVLDYSYVSGRESGFDYCDLGFYVRERGGVEVIGNIFDNQKLLEGGTR